MGQRLRAVALVAVLLGVGVLAGSAVSQWRGVVPSAGTEAGAGQGAGVERPSVRVRVEVLNGGGRPDMARRATDHLRERGFDVVYYGNADTFDRDSTVVLDRVGRPGFASAVAGALGPVPLSVRSEPDSGRFVDVTVVLGSSWNPPAGPAMPVEPVGRPAWWDLRRFLPERGRAPTARDGSGGRMADPANGGG